MSSDTPKYPPPPPPPPPSSYPGGSPALTNVGKPSQYWPLSIISFVLSWVIGGIALYFSWQVGERWNRGDAQGALKASKTAQTVAIAGIIVGVLFLFLYLGS